MWRIKVGENSRTVDLNQQIGGGEGGWTGPTEISTCLIKIVTGWDWTTKEL